MWVFFVFLFFFTNMASYSTESRSHKKISQKATWTMGMCGWMCLFFIYFFLTWIFFCLVCCDGSVRLVFNMYTLPFFCKSSKLHTADLNTHPHFSFFFGSVRQGMPKWFFTHYCIFCLNARCTTIQLGDLALRHKSKLMAKFKFYTYKNLHSPSLQAITSCANSHV